MEHTAKNFVLQLGSLVALYVSLSALILISFGIITVLFPDAATGYWEYDNAQSQIRFGIAMLIVFFPAYIVLTRIVNQLRRKTGEKYLTLTKWLIYLSLLVGGGILLGDLVGVIVTYLNGEITTRFILKALTLLVVIGVASQYYILDARGYWKSHEEKSKLFGALSTVVVIAVLVLGFFQTNTPAQVREMRLDEQQVTALQDIEWRIEEYYRVEGTLPETIETLYGGLSVPMSPENREAYEYVVLDSSSFELCATFVQESSSQLRATQPVMMDTAKNVYTWDHGVGKVCFKRVVEKVQ